MCSYTTHNRKFQKNSKNWKTPSQLLFKPKQDGNGRERERIKKNHSDEFLTNPEQKTPKKIQKIQKIQKKKKHYGFFSSQDRLGKAVKEIKQKKYSNGFLNDP